MKTFKLLLAGAMLAAGSAQATVYTYQYTAIIDSMQKQVASDGDLGPVNITSTTLPYGDPAQVGNVIHGQFMLDSSLSPSSSTSTSATYWGQNLSAYTEFPGGFSYGVKGPSEAGGQVGITNAASGDAIDITFDRFGSSTGHSLVLSFADPSGAALTSTQIPGSSLNFANLPDTTFYYYYGGDSFSTNLWVRGHITLVQLTSPVPEPATYGMLLAGLGLLGFAARKTTQKEKS